MPWIVDLGCLNFWSTGGAGFAHLLLKGFGTPFYSFYFFSDHFDIYLLFPHPEENLELHIVFLGGEKNVIKILVFF